MDRNSSDSIADLADVLDALIAREPIFHRGIPERSRAGFEQFTDPEFWEVGASGQRYDREYVWTVLEQRYAVDSGGDDEWEADDFRIRSLGADTYLLTYRLIQRGQRTTRRSTIWRRDGDGWTVLYHQGTIVADSDD